MGILLNTTTKPLAGPTASSSVTITQQLETKRVGVLHRLPDMGEADDSVFPQKTDAPSAGACGFELYQFL